MKEKSLFQYAFYALMVLLISCSSDEVVQDYGEAKRIVMSAQGFEFESDSRTAINITPQGGAFTWSANDTVGIFPDRGGQVYFPMVSGAGTNTAFFDGGGWALKPSSTYAAYYPFIGNIYQDKRAIPVDYSGQQQSGNASAAHLGGYDFLASRASSPSQGTVKFHFKHLGCLVELSFNLPHKDELKSVTLSSDKKFFVTRGVVDLSSSVPAVRALAATNTLVIPVTGLRTAADGDQVKIYFMMAPVDLTGQNLKLTLFNGADEYSSAIAGLKFEAGNGYRLAAQLQSNSHWVDLGLSVKWASHNVGADLPEGLGDYFAWGETAPKNNYTDATSPYARNSRMKDFSGDPQYDAATANWGAPARMPTRDEIKELVNNTTRRYVLRNGVYGCEFKSKKNNRSIFFPETGYWEGAQLYGGDTYGGNYWSSTPHESNANGAYRFNIKETNVSYAWYYRRCGYSVRPVADR